MRIRPDHARHVGKMGGFSKPCRVVFLPGIFEMAGSPSATKVGFVKWMIFALMTMGFCSAATVGEFIADAGEAHGAEGKMAAEFLVNHMPQKDRESLTTEYLSRNLDLAFQARAEFPWAKSVPEDIFLNDVLPYAVFDETRDPWRAEFLKIARSIVKGAPTASEAAQALNREFFKRVKVHYNTGRKAPNQSPKESMETGRATCTGLSIILVDACRAVGIPARAAGTPLWSNERGNHTWVEIWDGGWHFTGADEYDAQGLDHGWFTGDAADAKADDPLHAIYATSWRRGDLTFPMVWAQGNHDVAAVNVTASYAKPGGNDAMAKLGIRLFARRGGERMISRVRISGSAEHETSVVETKAGTTDLNDMPRVELRPGSKGLLSFTVGSEVREMTFGPLEIGDPTVDAFWTDLTPCSPEISALHAWLALSSASRKTDAPVLQTALSKQDAARAVFLLGGEARARLARDRKSEFEKRSMTDGDKTLRWLDKTFGEAPPGGHSLWISMHGGGGTTAEVNDGQWQNQIRLYQPTEGIYVAPRAPTDTWNLWHEAHIDPMFQRLIEDYVVLRGVNPNRIYLMGYSAGGDGVWQLAPRMADRFAAAAMMAGHPNESSLLGLRNLPFAIFMGGEDAAYQRNQIAANKITELDALEGADPGAYVHMSRIYEGLGHWMNHKDAEALPWMVQFKRNPWPRKIVWVQDDVTHQRFYWLGIPNGESIKAGRKIVATVDGQTIRLDGDVPEKTSLLLSDELLDLDREVIIFVNGKSVISAKVARTADAIRQCLDERLDLPATATAILILP